MIDVIGELRKLTDKTSQSAVARKIGVSAAFINMVLRRQKKPSPKVLKFLGLEQETKFRRSK